MFKVVIFDLVGVLSKNRNIYTIFKKITKYKGTVKSLEAYMKKAYNKLLIGGTTELVFWNKLKKVTSSRKSIDSLKKSFFRNFKPLVKKETFEKVKENFEVVLCTNFVNSWWLYLKNKFKLKFDYEVLSSSLKIAKPDPKIFLNVPLFYKLSPEECAFVSDEEEDLETAKELGMTTIFIPGENKSYKNADYYYENIQALLEVLS